jgi:hypothetical protein
MFFKARAFRISKVLRDLFDRSRRCSSLLDDSLGSLEILVGGTLLG